jgi:D-glycero-alpha-D-manno-heptose 1-phosphate guanylyltransferase
MTMEAIILAGGLGTRLSPVIQGIPKVLAPVGNRPFLELLLRRLRQKGFSRIVLSVGFLASMIRERFGDRFEGMALAYSAEESPLGTGGAVLKAINLASSTAPFVLNGDTFVDLDYASMLASHIEASATVSIAVAQVADGSRFGRLLIHENRVTGFAEKGRSGPGQINAGAYVMNRDIFSAYALPEVFSLETGFFVPHVEQLRPLAFLTSGYFIDIGIPEDLARAQCELGIAE